MSPFDFYYIIFLLIPRRTCNHFRTNDTVSNVCLRSAYAPSICRFSPNYTRCRLLVEIRQCSEAEIRYRVSKLGRLRRGVKHVKWYLRYRRIDLVPIKPYLISRFCAVKNNNWQQPYSFIYYYNYCCYIDPAVFFLQLRSPPYYGTVAHTGCLHRLTCTFCNLQPLKLYKYSSRVPIWLRLL